VATPGDEEDTMAEEPLHEPLLGTPRFFARPPADGTDEGIHQWASDFVDAVLGPVSERPDVDQ